MKALQIQQSARTFDRASRSISSEPVINISEKACLIIGIAAAIAFVISLSFQCITAIVASGLTALIAVAMAPSQSKKGGES